MGSEETNEAGINRVLDRLRDVENLTETEAKTACDTAARLIEALWAEVEAGRKLRKPMSEDEGSRALGEHRLSSIHTDRTLKEIEDGL